MRDLMTHTHMPTCGVFHAGGILKDAMLAQQNISGLMSVSIGQGSL